MARTLAELPKGSRISDYISLGVIAETFPLERIQAVLAATGKAGKRQRDLPVAAGTSSGQPGLAPILVT